MISNALGGVLTSLIKGDAPATIPVHVDHAGAATTHFVVCECGCIVRYEGTGEHFKEHIRFQCDHHFDARASTLDAVLNGARHKAFQFNVEQVRAQG